MNGSMVAASRRLVVRSTTNHCLFAHSFRAFSTSLRRFEEEQPAKTRKPRASKATTEKTTTTRTTKKTTKTSSKKASQEPTKEEIEVARDAYNTARARTDAATEQFASTCRLKNDGSVEVIDAEKHETAKSAVEAAYEELIPAQAALNKLLGNPPLAEPQGDNAPFLKLDEDSDIASLLQSRETEQEPLQVPSKTQEPIQTPQPEQPKHVHAQPQTSLATTQEISSIPSRLLPSSLITNHVATASHTTQARRATILAAQAHLARRDSTSFGFDSLLAKSLRYGKAVRFANEDEKLRAVALAQEQSDDAAMRMSLQKKKVIRPSKVEFQAAPREYRENIVDRVAKGKYEEGQGQQQEQTRSLVGIIGKQLLMNQTFRRKSGFGFVETIKRLLPQASKS